ncbi:Extracellular exo-alpha-(1-_5)-L-arabinofuranosidase [Madurella mycetomatis]|uniref:Extracellular exo-alpha-(1->5)-L-arabinofuranosidase n=1 Tax=Madurella mycetomatis TaxID=100816 RepID=A0A175W3S2_9PEZI|nr:Extracellular exo-alpha-(1->5)-L-arabinofuranosidase [Madurella mycetomatis]
MQATLWLLWHAIIFLGAWTSFAHAFTNPIKTRDGSDPFIVYYDGMYYLTSTTWSNIVITASPTIEGLKTASPQVVWTDRNAARCCNVWAPEMHKVAGRWYIYYTAGPDVNDFVQRQRVWVLQGGTGDPLSAAYSFVSQITPPNYSQGMLDATVYNISGKSYFIYSSTVAPASLYIAELLTPTTTGLATMISRPELPWERQGWSINEGPAGLTSPNGTHYVVFSASGCNTEHYKLGALKLSTGSDPLQASSWTKLPDPLFTTANGLHGPGHNAFFKSPDGTQDWNVYHANRSPSGGCDGGRQTFVQPVGWNSDDTPDLGAPMAPGTQIQPPSGEGPQTLR